MNSLRDIVELSPQLRVIETQANYGSAPQPLAPPRWDWSNVQRVLLVRLRSIGDTVLATPSLFALKRFLPNVKVDILVEDWVAPLLDNHPHVDNVVVLERGGFMTRATGARYRVGFKTYQYAQLHNHQAPSPLLLWGQPKTHSVEQQLALL